MNDRIPTRFYDGDHPYANELIPLLIEQYAEWAAHNEFVRRCVCRWEGAGGPECEFHLRFRDEDHADQVQKRLEGLAKARIIRMPNIEAMAGFLFDNWREEHLQLIAVTLDRALANIGEGQRCRLTSEQWEAWEAWILKCPLPQSGLEAAS